MPQEAQRHEGSNLWLFTAAELLALHGDFPLESVTGTKKMQAELLDSYGELKPEATNHPGLGVTGWGYRSDDEPTVHRQLEP